LAESNSIIELNHFMPKTLEDDLESVDKILDSKRLADFSTALELKTALGKEYIRYALANTLLFDRKQFDYGPGNIAKFGVVGCVIRASDKFERIANLFKANRKKAANEALIDSYRDIHVYMNIIQMVEKGVWR